VWGDIVPPHIQTVPVIRLKLLIPRNERTGKHRKPARGNSVAAKAVDGTMEAITVPTVGERTRPV
jgi:hypothetical protein